MSIQIEVGQKWKFKKASRNSYFTEGKAYEILAFNPSNGQINITDNNGKGSNNGKGHIWHATETEFFAKFEPAFPVQIDVKAAIADRAKDIVNGSRRSAYGTPEDNFERIARFWNVYLVNVGIFQPDVLGDPAAKNGLTAADVSPMMRLMKEARLCETPDHLDSFIDLVGYALTGAEVNKVDPSDLT